MVEHAAHNRGVAGSIPATTTKSPIRDRVLASGQLMDGSRHLLALSGGPDSTALLLALRELGVDVAAAHFDHALRPESADEARQVAQLCRRLGVPLITGRRRRPMPAGSPQAGARAIRYEFLESARLRAGAACVLTAHTADDLVEGAVLHLLRGAGPAGLRGMPARRGAFRRPLLEVWRVEIEAYLAASGVEVLRDPSNLDLRYARVQVRQRLLPRLESDRPGISRRLHAVALGAAVIQADLERRAARLVDGDLVALRSADWPVRWEAYRQMYTAAGGQRPGLGRRHLSAMDRAVMSGHAGDGVDLPSRLRFDADASRAEVRAPSVAAPVSLPVMRVRPCPGAACSEPSAVHLDARLGPSLLIGHRRPGLRIRPAHGRGTRKLQDLLVDAKVPRRLRDSLPLVFAGDRLAWVPGLAVELDCVPTAGSGAVHVSLEEPARPHARIPPS